MSDFEAEEPTQTIDGPLLDRLLRFQAELQHALALKQISDLQAQIEVHRHTEKMRVLQFEADKANTNYQAAVRAIETKYGILLKDYAFEPETGALVSLKQP